MIQAFSCAANCLLYERDPGPAELNIGSEAEPHFVSRSDAGQDFYARYLLTQLDGDSDRLQNTANRCRRRWARGRRRTRDAEDMRPERWKRAVELCDLAVGIVDVAGAADDEQAWQRLLAGNGHMLTAIAFGSWGPQVVKDSADDLAQRLREIDDE